MILIVIKKCENAYVVYANFDIEGRRNIFNNRASNLQDCFDQAVSLNRLLRRRERVSEIVGDISLSDKERREYSLRIAAESEFKRSA